MKFNGPKVKMSRKLGIALTPKAERFMEKKPYGPGQHAGVKRRRRSGTDYGKQLMEKQRLRFQYNISEKQLSNYFKKAKQKTGNTGDNLMKLLESRLDAVVLRSGLVRTIFAARQFVRHGHFLVNNKKVNIPSYLVKPEDVIAVREKSKNINAFRESLGSANPPSYLELSKPKMTTTVVRQPDREDIPVLCDVLQVVEFYSR